jgi:molybdate transport system ATP-binding protein
MAMTGTPLLAVDLEKNRGGRRIRLAFSMGRGLTALTGPSGVGKTTALDMIAGLLAPDRGRVELGGCVLTDTASGANVPPHRRGIGYVFQDARLFPHLSVQGNLHYGRRALGLPRDDAEETRVIAMLGIGPLLARRPLSLSGGEKQRAAIGRALLTRPSLLLLDEPLASVDAARKGEILEHIERVRDELGVPILYVTHSEDETRRLADAVVRLDPRDGAAEG